MEKLEQQFKQQLQELTDLKEMANLKAHFLGKKGLLTEVLKNLKDLAPEERVSVGQKANILKEKMLKEISEKIADLEFQEIQKKDASRFFDESLRDRYLFSCQQQGGLHPVTSLQREVEDIFISMGFAVMDGPHVEDDYHNFTALNIGPHHPAREMQDTFWLDDQLLLRTHTSSVQIRGMQSILAQGGKPPFRFVAPGKVFRNERTDAGHEMVFHQVEGMMVAEGLTVGHLIYSMKTLLKNIFGKEVKVRLRPGYFPFVEPGFELDIYCLLCQGKGCSACKNSGWLELLPCGMVHPKVLEYGGIDYQKYSGFAFGLGLDRLVMMRYAIDDIRHIHSADLRFVSQFGAGLKD